MKYETKEDIRDGIILICALIILYMISVIMG
jgi:hypothetical protein